MPAERSQPLTVDEAGEYLALPTRIQCMSLLRKWQWSLQSMFGLLTACAIMMCWLRLSMSLGDEWSRRTLTLARLIALVCLEFWVLQSALAPRFGLPREEVFAAAILISAFDTVYGILCGMCMICCESHRKIGELTERICQENAVSGFGFVFACALAALAVLPAARASLRSSWLFLLVALVAGNLGLLLIFCLQWALYLEKH